MTVVIQPTGFKLVEGTDGVKSCFGVPTDSVTDVVVGTRSSPTAEDLEIDELIDISEDDVFGADGFMVDSVG